MIPQGYLEKLAQIESGGNPAAVNPQSGAAGLYQFMPATARQYGLSNPLDPAASMEAVKRLTMDNYNVLEKGLGRPPSQGELYLAHQQGATGALKLLANSQLPATQVRGQQAIVQNAGSPDMTAGQFSRQWVEKFEGAPMNNTYAMQQPLTAEEEAELAALEAEIGGLTAEEEAELAALEAELSQEMPAENVTEEVKAQDRPMGKEIARQVGLAARYGAEGLAGLADLPNLVINEAVISPINAVSGSNIGKLQYPSEYVRQGLNELGLPSPQGSTERVVGDVSRSIAGLGGGLSALSSLAAKVPQAASAIAPLTEGVGAQLGGAIGSSAAAGTTREMGGGALAQLGAGLAGGLAGGALGNRLSAQRQAANPRPTSDDIRKQANRLYQEAQMKGGELSPAFTDDFIDRAAKVMPQTTAGKIIGGDDPVSKVVERMQGLRGRSLTLPEAQEVDEYLGQAIDSFTEMGRVTKQGKKLLDIQSEFRSMISNVSPNDVVGGTEGFEALKRGRQLWARQAKLRDVERIIERAELMDNPATGIKSGFRTLLNNPNRLKGFSEAERKAIKAAAETGAVADTLRVFGSRLIPIVTASSGGGIGGAAAAQVGSTLSRDAATRLQMSRANALADLIAGSGNAKPAANTAPQAIGALQGLLQTDQ